MYPDTHPSVKLVNTYARPYYAETRKTAFQIMSQIHRLTRSRLCLENEPSTYLRIFRIRFDNLAHDCVVNLHRIFLAVANQTLERRECRLRFDYCIVWVLAINWTR